MGRPKRVDGGTPGSELGRRPRRRALGAASARRDSSRGQPEGIGRPRGDRRRGRIGDSLAAEGGSAAPEAARALIGAKARRWGGHLTRIAIPVAAALLLIAILP